MANLPLTVDDWRFKDRLKEAIADAIGYPFDDTSLQEQTRILNECCAAVVGVLKETKPSFEECNVSPISNPT